MKKSKIIKAMSDREETLIRYLGEANSLLRAVKSNPTFGEIPTKMFNEKQVEEVFNNTLNEILLDADALASKLRENPTAFINTVLKAVGLVDKTKDQNLGGIDDSEYDDFPKTGNKTKTSPYLDENDPRNDPLCATKLAGLTQFAGEVFYGPRGTYTLDEYRYFDDTPFYSTVRVKPTIIEGKKFLKKGTVFELFDRPSGDIINDDDGNVIYGVSSAETNLQRGMAGGKFPANQAYVALAASCDVYSVKSGRRKPLSEDDKFNIGYVAIPTFNVGGNQSPLMIYQPIKSMIHDGEMHKFAFPLMYPPNICASYNITIQEDVEVEFDIDEVAIMVTFAGYTLSKVR